MSEELIDSALTCEIVARVRGRRGKGQEVSVRSAPTARQRRLGAELRRMREAAGLKVVQAAEHLGVERTRISNIEAGRLGVSEERVRSLASVYQCGDQAYVDALAAMTEDRFKGWWEDFRGKVGVGALDLAELEHHAVLLRSMQMMHFPGLLQTEEYAKAVFSMAVPEPTPVELRRRLSYRMRRRDVLDRDDPPTCTFLLHEAAARLDFGGAAVMRSQVKQILEASERENVTVRVIPFSAGGFPNAGSSITYAAGPVPQLDTVQLDAPNDILLLDVPAALHKYRITLDRVERLSLTVEKTRDLLHNVMKQL
jgi:transcriptional regulator with XRE-family HTH domain